MLFIQMLAPKLFKPADELGVFFILIIIGLDMVVNRQYTRYKNMFVVVGVLAFYAVYSLFLKFNTPKAILIDFVIESKPFVPFFIGYAIAPRYTHKECQMLKATCIAIASVLPIIYFTGCTFVVIHHVVYIGSTAFICFITYIYCSIRSDGTISRRDFAIAMCILSVGLICTRSKYFGETVLAVFMLFFYRPGMFKKLRVKQVVILSLVVAAVLVVSWKKISFYFIDGTEGAFDTRSIQAFARPALLGGMFLILCDFPLFGTGLASYATYASSPDVNYSAVYAMYDLDKVFGLSEQFYEFICDIFYAELAQFGLVGIGLFIYFFVWIYQRLRLNLHDESHYMFVIGVLVIAYVMIENVGGTLFSQSGGLYLMMLLGTIIGKYRKTDKAERKAILQLEYK